MEDCYENPSRYICGRSTSGLRLRLGIRSAGHRRSRLTWSHNTIDGKQLPPPDPEFGGVIKDDALQSKPWWAPRVVPPKGAPNVLLIITDDAGFGVPSTFGGVIPTPTMDRITNEGLRYNRIFSTALCSPTRAALTTGRIGVVSEQSTGFPRLQQHHRPGHGHHWPYPQG